MVPTPTTEDTTADYVRVPNHSKNTRNARVLPGQLTIPANLPRITVPAGLDKDIAFCTLLAFISMAREKQGSTLLQNSIDQLMSDSNSNAEQIEKTCIGIKRKCSALVGHSKFSLNFSANIGIRGNMHALRRSARDSGLDLFAMKHALYHVWSKSIDARDDVYDVEMKNIVHDLIYTKSRINEAYVITYGLGSNIKMFSCLLKNISQWNVDKFRIALGIDYHSKPNLWYISTCLEFIQERLV